MDYGKLITRSLRLAWDYKSLWIFGLFAGWGSTFNLNFPSGDLGEELGDLGGPGFGGWDMATDIEAYLPLFAALLGALLVLAVIFLVLDLISVPALIDAVNRITRGGTYRFSVSFSRGIDFFWRFLGLFLITMLAVIATVIVIIILFITIIGIIVAIPAIFFAAYFWFTLFELARRVLVARDCSIGDALSEAYLLIKRHFSKTLIMGLIVLGLLIASSVAVMLLWLIVGLPVGAITWGITNSLGWGLVLGILFGLPVSLVVGGYLGTFFTSLYTMFYFELVEPSVIEPKADAAPAGPSA